MEVYLEKRRLVYKNKSSGGNIYVNKSRYINRSPAKDRKA